MSFREAQKTGKQQEESLKHQEATLDASRQALESVVATARGQQDLLRQDLEIHREQWAKELERLARKPRLEITLGNTPWQVLRRNPTITLIVGKEYWATLTFDVRNKGNAPVVQPVVLIVASPPTVELVEPISHGVPRQNRNVFQISGSGVLEFQPETLAGEPYRITVDAWAPPDLREFDVVFQIHGQNLKVVKTGIHFQIIRTNS